MTTLFEWNVSEQYLRVENISERLNDSPDSTRLLVVSTVKTDGAIDNQPVTEAAQYRLPIEVDEAVFEPASMQGSALSDSTTRQITRQQTYVPLWRLGGPTTIIFDLLGLIGITYVQVGTELLSISDAERSFVTFQTERNRNRNAIERIFREFKYRTSSFNNCFSHAQPETFEQLGGNGE
ncbi:MAG: hypothetical protein J07HQW2_03096 [Haloquadratum walsbyi J07HQW2]|jgi:hypothetical protein|uniref:Uncharacterized protein n=1 Tax=Haloquadratum walsbyi J07HQW2 TaxID=1238425 RepID=U1N194_9EURY|nr:MAG: hypothetical protein J07HQW2_03096 [Haloquadratum walsbyi J07HQW2]